VGAAVAATGSITVVARSIRITIRADSGHVEA
jgi:hypothetical protein